MISDDFNFEIKRKIFHLYSLILPLAYIFTPRIIMSIFLVVLTGFTLYVDISRHHNTKIKELTHKFFGKYLRGTEQTGTLNLSGASFMAFGFLISCLFFSKGLAITSWFILIIADCLAALFGKKFGEPLANGKSLVGAGIFFVSSIFISIVSYFFVNFSTSFTIVILASAAVTAVEFYSKELKIDDNFSIPVSYCLTTFILSWVF